MSKEKKVFKKYSPEFKLSVILDMYKNNLNYHEVVRKYNLGDVRTGGARNNVRRWNRIYLEEGEKGLFVEHRGGARMKDSKNSRLTEERTNSISKEALIAENQRLKEKLFRTEMELEYLKKLDALVRAEEQRKNKKPR